MIGQNRCTMGAPVDRLPFLLSRKNPNCMPDCICKVRSKGGHAVIVVGNKTSDQWGDCKGKAVALYQTLQENGAGNVRLVIGKHRLRDHKTHAWVEWETPQGTFLLDPTLNWTATLTDLQDRSTYIPLYAFAGGHKYRAYNPALMTAQDSWSRQVAARD